MHRVSECLDLRAFFGVEQSRLSSIKFFELPKIVNDSKSVEPQGSVGSNPTVSAKKVR